jgi:hypothetical protein
MATTEAEADGPDLWATLFPGRSGREMLLIGADLVTKAAWWDVGCRKLRTLGLLLAYDDRRIRDGSRGGRRRTRIVDIDGLVASWVDVLVGLTTAHDAQGHDGADFRTDELLGPLLVAPIADVRAFAERLAGKLEADPRVPYMVWRGYKRLVLPIFENRPVGDQVQLRADLAREVALMAERGIDRGELVDAIAGALQWRGPQTLGAVKEGLQAGRKPRIRGRESCLFLELDGEDGEPVARVML